MQVEVRPINRLGQPQAKREREKSPACRGRLRVFENRLHAFGRVVQCATLTSLTDGLEQQLLPDLLDARLIWLDDKAMRFAGVELVKGTFYGQTWEVKVL